MTPLNDKAEVLRKARETFAIAERALRDATDPAARDVAIRNVVIFGRAVTNIVENLRSRVSGFDEWYKPLSEGMSRDPVLKFFYTLRSRILKQGDKGTSSYAITGQFDQAAVESIRRKFPPPPNTVAFVHGDQQGGTGWRVEVSPGTFEMYYIELPSAIGVAGLAFDGAPTGERDALVLCRYYLDAIGAFLKAAEARWL